MSFVHLHVHTQYSLLAGSIRMKALCQRAAELGMPAVAVTDLNNLFGAIDFYFSAKAAGVKPILGCEVFFAPQGRAAVGAISDDPRVFHLILLCKDQEGYQNLCELVTRAYVEAPEMKKGEKPGPRAVVDRDLLKNYSKGLVALSGCLRGELAYKVLRKDESEVLESIQWFQKVFGEDYYLELQDTSIPEQEQINETLFRLGEKLGIEVVASSDCHYLNSEDAEAQEILQCIEQNRNLDFDRPTSLVPPEFYFKDAETMKERFERYPRAVENTLKIADKCRLEFQFTDESGKMIYHLPAFRPDGVSKDQAFDDVEYFRKESRAGLERRFEEPSFQNHDRKQEYYDRLESELEMIARTGFSSYFLIVADFINWAKRNEIPVGPGRGSGAGSLVSYALRITDLDPIQFNLLFERFINPERISMPDFDVDFCQDRRAEVIEYVTRKYGKENVCQIITFGKLQTRAVIKDVSRVLGLTFAEADQMTKLIPDELNIRLKDALEREPRLGELMDADPKIKKVMDYALSLEGLYRNAGVHAAGVIITEKPVVRYCPLYVGKEGSVVTQFDKDFAERIGLVKFDFLGLKTLTVIDNAVRLVRSSETGNPDFDISKIDMEDPKVFELISSADTDGVFQVESSGMKDLCARLRPGSIEDLTAINALYRPGPLGSGMVDTFIECKHGRMPIEYELPALEPILKETYGVILYQEQVMQIARVLAGYSLGQADMLRRAMGKKKADEMARHRGIFVEGAQKKEIPKAKAEVIFDLMAKFAEYGFNKSHSAAYAVLTYQTAYLKCHYPAEFMAALMTTELNNTDKLAKYIADARDHSIRVLPPDVNLSEKKFSVKEGAIRFGLEAVKGVGGIAVDSILEAREEKLFENAADFVKRVPTRKVNKKVLEALTLSGAFDEISEVNRASLFASIESLVSFGADEQEERAFGQSSLFDSFSSEEIKLVTPVDSIFKRMDDWPQAQKLAKEKQVVGFYVSGHPMDQWQRVCEDWLGWNTLKLKEYAEATSAAAAPQPSGPGTVYQRPVRKEVRLGGLISEIKEITTKKGKRMAFAQFEDLRGKVELVLFPDSFLQLQERVREALTKAEPVILTGELEVREEVPKIFVGAIEWARDANQGRVKKVICKLDPAKVSVEQLRALKSALLEHRGRCSVLLEFQGGDFATNLTLPSELKVAGTPKMAASINRIFGADVVNLA